MDIDFAAWLEQFDGQAFELHQQHLNPSFVKMLCAIKFDKPLRPRPGVLSVG